MNPHFFSTPMTTLAEFVSWIRSKNIREITQIKLSNHISILTGRISWMPKTFLDVQIIFRMEDWSYLPSSEKEEFKVTLWMLSVLQMRSTVFERKDAFEAKRRHFESKKGKSRSIYCYDFSKVFDHKVFLKEYHLLAFSQKTLLLTTICWTFSSMSMSMKIHQTSFRWSLLCHREAY